MYDIIVIGGGPAGLTSAVYAKRAGKSVLVLEKASFGGQITYSHKIENFPSAQSISGTDLADRMMEQALSQGADIELEEALKITKTDTGFHINTDFSEYDCKAVIIATGAKHRTLGAEGEEKFIGNGISFCAVCDGAFYAGKEVAVIGGGNSALVEASLLAETCKKVTVVQNLDRLTGEKQVADALLKRSNVEVIYSTVVESFKGENELEAVVLKNDSGETREIHPDGVFVAIGLAPDNKAFEEFVALDSYGYADANENCKTKTEGIFVAGDCRTKQVRQITTAVADGAVAALGACAYVDSI
ncbi:MAG: FAD-dependent oxidoreductase [Eubacteriales bacterium]|nr:FAD-dependent oxidoreductase [Eubacteriales bacterium]